MKKLFSLLALAPLWLSAQVPQIGSSVQFKDTRTSTNTALSWLDTNKPTRTSGAVDPSATCAAGDVYIQTATRHLWACFGATSTDWLDIGFVGGSASFAGLVGDPSDNVTLGAALNAKADLTSLTSHTSNVSNPHSTTKTQIGLASVVNALQLQAALNLSDLGNSLTARSNLGLGGAAILNVGTATGTVAAGDHLHTSTYAALSHGHASSDITSGLLAIARLAGSGTCDSTTVLYGDQVCRTPPGSSGGEANTVSNQGSSGVGIFKSKLGVDLGFYKLNAASSKVSITLNASDYIDFDVVPGNIAHQTLSGAGTNTHAQIDTHLAATNNPHGTTAAQVSAPALVVMTTLGDLPYRDNTTWVRLAGNTVAAKRLLCQTGTGSVSAAPTWCALVAGDIPTLNQNTTGSAASLSAASALPNGTTVTTQTQADNSTKAASTAYVDTGLATRASSTASTTVNGTTCTLGSTCTVADATKQPTSTKDTNGGYVGRDSSGNATITGTMTASNFSGDATKNGTDYLQGFTSGGLAFSVANIAGTAVTLVWPADSATATTGYVPTLGATVTCPTLLPSWAPSTCRSLSWGAGGGTANPASVVTTTFSATPTFTCPSSTAGTVTTFKLSTALTASITSSTLASCTSGQTLHFVFTQDGTGGRTVVMPSGFDAAPVSPTASKRTTLTYTWDGTTGSLINSSNDTPSILFLTERTAPSTPASGTQVAWPDSTSHTLKTKDSSGNVYTTVKGVANPSDSNCVTYIDQDGVQQRGSCGSGSAASVVTATFSATPTFTCPSATTGAVTTFKLSTSLTANITSSTLATCTSGQTLHFVFTQDGTGGRTVVMPSGFDSAPVSPTASKTTTLTYVWENSTGHLINSSTDDPSILLLTERAAPGTPASGKTYCWPDSTDHSGFQCKSNGSSSVFKMVLTGADIATTTGQVTATHIALNASSTINFGSIDDGTCATNTFTLTGAAAGDALAPKWPSTLETGLFGSMVATATNTVQVRLCNLSGSAVDPASQSFGAFVIR